MLTPADGVGLTDERTPLSRGHSDLYKCLGSVREDLSRSAAVVVS
jgi:hypothetical protein